MQQYLTMRKLEKTEPDMNVNENKAQRCKNNHDNSTQVKI